jgi:hypothetical protein
MAEGGSHEDETLATTTPLGAMCVLTGALESAGVLCL